MFLPNVGYIQAIRAAIKSHLGFMVRHFGCSCGTRVLGIWGGFATMPLTCPRVIPEAPTKNPDKSESGLQTSQYRSAMRLPAGCNQRRESSPPQRRLQVPAIAPLPVPKSTSLLLQLSCPAVLADATAKSIKHSVSGRGIKTAAETI